MDSQLPVTADLANIFHPDGFPSDVFKFMIKNASSYQRSKLMEVGKHFYPKEFVKIEYADINQYGIRCYKRKDDHRHVNDELCQSLWIAKKLYFEQSSDAVFRSLPKTVAWNLQYLEIKRQVISYENFKFLTAYGCLNFLRMEYAPIQYNDTKKEVPLEKIFEMIPKCIELSFYRSAPPIVSWEAAVVNRPSGLDGIHLYYIDDEKFDFKTFSSFMINNQDFGYYISFKNGLSEAHSKELKSITVKIMKAWNDKTDLPTIQFL